MVSNRFLGRDRDKKSTLNTLQKAQNSYHILCKQVNITAELMLIKNVPLAFPSDSYSTIQKTPMESQYYSPGKPGERQS